MEATTARNSARTKHALAGLSRRPEGLSPNWFYDPRGSELFEAITTLAEYYLGRAERAILAADLSEITAHVPNGAVLVELGSGASVKSRLLLDGLRRLPGYISVDVSTEFLSHTASKLAADYPDLAVTPSVGDFMAEIVVPDLGGRPVVGFLPGSTLGHLDPDGAVALLARLRAWPDRAAVIFGVDLVKAPELLEAAYDDAPGARPRRSSSIGWRG